MNDEAEFVSAAALIQRRISDMRDNDRATGEHPDASDEEYLLWALEECVENNELDVTLSA